VLNTVTLEPQRATFFPIPSGVNFVAKTFPAVDVFHPDSPALQVLAKVASQSMLHQEIREKGGAYGGGATAGSRAVSFYSYRDPHLLRTLNTFDNCITWAQNGSFTQQNIDEAMLSIFSSVDAPIPPSRKGKEVFAAGITHAMRQQYAHATNTRQRSWHSLTAYTLQTPRAIVCCHP
jgi:presequence protease